MILFCQNISLAGANNIYNVETFEKMTLFLKNWPKLVFLNFSLDDGNLGLDFAL